MRSSATCIPAVSPPPPPHAHSASPPRSLYKGLKELKELISSYQSMRDSGRAVAVCATIIETARQCNLDKARRGLLLGGAGRRVLGARGVA